MNKHETKACPRCNGHFECKSGSILLCHCQTILISPEQLDYIAAKYDDCLCHRCLLEIRDEYQQQQHVQRIAKITRYR